MNNFIFYFVLILLVFATTINCGGKANGLLSKFNERRAAGILAQPRVGRTTGMSSFTRLDGVAGLVHYPRVGRSGSFPHLTSFHPDPPLVPEANHNLLNHGEIDIASLINLQYQNHPYDNNHGQQQVHRQQVGISTNNRHGVKQSRYGTIRGDQQHSRLHHCTNRLIGGARALLFAPPEGKEFHGDSIRLTAFNEMIPSF